MKSTFPETNKVMLNGPRIRVTVFLIKGWLGERGMEWTDLLLFREKQPDQIAGVGGMCGWPNRGDCRPFTYLILGSRRAIILGYLAFK